MPSTRRPEGRRSRRRAKAEAKEALPEPVVPQVVRATPIVAPTLVSSQEDGYFRRLEELR